MVKKECDKCGSKLVYVRIKTNELVCRGCGNIKKMNTQIIRRREKNE